MNIRRKLMYSVVSLALVASCSTTGESDSSTPTETAVAQTSTVDGEVCEKIAHRTDQLYERYDNFVAANSDDAEMAMQLYMVGLERITREMRRGSRVVEDPELTKILEKAAAEHDYSYEIFLRDISDDQRTNLFTSMDAANTQCETLGLATASVDTATFPMGDEPDVERAEEPEE